MENFKLPTNVRQIGSIEASGLRIYVEDYVFTYVHQYAQANPASERLGILVGRYIESEPEPILFISGAIESKYTLQSTNGAMFSKKADELAPDVLDKYFPGLEIVGWFQSQPGYGTYLSSKSYGYHRENFTKKHHVFFVTDPAQRMDAFYVYNDGYELCESRGYFVYYDKNKPMHEYMIDSRMQNAASKTADRAVLEGVPEIVAKESEVRSIQAMPVSKRRIRELREATEDSGTYTGRNTLSRRSSGSVSGSNSGDQKKLVNMLTALCAVMFLVSFIMGAGLIRSDERINALEYNFSALSDAHRHIAANMITAADVPAFAPEVRAEIGLAVTEDGNRLLAEENARVAEQAPGGTEAAFAPAPEVPALPPADPPDPPPPATPPPAAQAPLTPPVTPDPPTPPPTETPPATVAAAFPSTYVVQAGDSLNSISRRVYGTIAMVERIMEANDIEDPDRIFLGQVLILPQP